MVSKGFVTNGSTSKRDAGVPAEHRAYDEIRFDQSLPNITRMDYERYGINQEMFLEMIEVTKWGFKHLTGFDTRGIDVIYRYERGTNGYAVVDPSTPFFIHIDESLDLELFGLTLLFMLWMRDFDKDPLDTFFFKHALFTMNEQFVLGHLPHNTQRECLLSRASGDMFILDWASDLYWSMMVFTVAHELTHIYQATTKPAFWKARTHGAEYHADAMGYRTLLTLIGDKKVGSFELGERTCLAPFMYLDYFRLADVTDQILYGTNHGPSDTHPSIERRSNALYRVYAKSNLASEEATIAHQWFLYLSDEYTRMLREYTSDGKLDKVRFVDEKLEL